MGEVRFPASLDGPAIETRERVVRSFSKRLIAPLVAVAALVGTGAALADANGRSGFESAPFGQPRTAPHDDGWRRTADGWERIDRWGEYASIYPGAAEPYVGS